MRFSKFAILSFAAGVLCLQMQAHLPSLAMILLLAGVAGAAVLAGVMSMRGKPASGRACQGNAPGKARRPFMPERMALLGAGFALLAFTLGFAWAGWRAHLRLADALPAEWEGRDVTLTGIVAALPHRFARGERFELTVESVQTPGAHVPKHLQLTWYDERSGRDARAQGENRRQEDSGKNTRRRGDNSTENPSTEAVRTARVHTVNSGAGQGEKPAVAPVAASLSARVAAADSGADSGADLGVGSDTDSGVNPVARSPISQTANVALAPPATTHRATDDASDPLGAANPPASPARAAGGRLHPGERWRLTVRLRRPHGNANPQGFDYEAWLLERNIRALGAVRPDKRAGNSADSGVGGGGNKRLDAFVVRPGYLVERLREAVRDRFVAALPDAPYRGVLVALAIGDQRAIPSAQWTLFNRTGVTHLVSISGLHVTMLAALFAWLVGWLWRRSERLMLRLPAPKAALLAGWLAACAYALLAGFEVPVQRTLYMLSVAVLALCSGRNFGSGRILLAALFVVLLIDPWAVLSIGFWLSFGAVGALLYAGGTRLRQSERPAGVARWRALALHWGAAQWAVTVAGLPLLLLFFQQFSLVSPLANALAIPVVSLLITPLTLLCAVLPWSWLLHADHWLLAQLMAVLHELSAWPVWQQPAPPLWAILLALGGVAGLLLPRGFPARWLGSLLLLPALLWQAPRPPAGDAGVAVLAVGLGWAVAGRPATHNLLYDAGPRYSAEADAGQRVVAPFLRAAGIGRLDVLLISHSDTDHAGGLASIQASLPVARLLSSAPAAFGGEACAAGQHWMWNGVRFSLLHPDEAVYADTSAQPNHLSCVLKIEAAGSRALLTGDIDAAAEARLLAREAKRNSGKSEERSEEKNRKEGADAEIHPTADAANGTSAKGLLAALPTLRSEVIVAPHHGSRRSSTRPFLAAVGAHEAVFSAGYRNAFGHPHTETLARYVARSNRIWRTDTGGAIHIRLAARAEVSSWRQVRQRYWQMP